MSYLRIVFRLVFTIHIIAYAVPVLRNNIQIKTDKFIQLHVLDLSAGGMKIRTAFILPTDKSIIFRFHFQLMKETFVFEGQLIWKQTNNKYNDYGIKFVETTEINRQRLVKRLNSHEMTKVQFKKPQFYAKTLVNPFLLKIIEILPYPACLVNLQRQVVAANKTAIKEFGIIPGQSCYYSIFNTHETCGNCRLLEALSSGQIISQKINLEGKDYLMHWLLLQENICLHYFIQSDSNPI